MVSTRSKNNPPAESKNKTDSAPKQAEASAGEKRANSPFGDIKDDPSSKHGHTSKKAKTEQAHSDARSGRQGKTSNSKSTVEDNDQKTIEETIQGQSVEVTDENKAQKEVKAKDEAKDQDINEAETSEDAQSANKQPQPAAKKEEEGVKGEKKGGGNGKDDENGKNGEQGGDIQAKDKSAASGASNDDDDEPKHGTLESGHIYFLYRPKVETEDPEGIDDVSKFHILLIPKTGKHASGHYHRIIEVGKKKLPDPGAKHQVIWGLVGNIDTDKAGLKDVFGAKDYQTKTRGPRHQPAARPAARGHYVLHSPRDELADSPSHDRQRDYKTLLAYEITTPAHEDFGNVQAELGIEEKGAVVLQVKDPNAESRGNPRAAGIPREKRAQYPPHLHEIFRNRRFIPANPVSLLDYQGAEVLIITSPHKLKESLGKNGEQVEDDLDHDAAAEEVNVDEALRELGLGKKEFEEEALEGSWA
ncbi:hypothetical protein IAU59_001815 [Kwoniella sp. CBS 9459]